MNLRDRIGLKFATGLGVGFLPGPTGTYGSVLGVFLYCLAVEANLPSALPVIAVVLFFLAVGASYPAIRVLKHEDPQEIVCDEICGQWISLLFLSYSWKIFLASFLLFRFFDIVKPFPARRLEHLPAGWGVVADDAMAGIYANVALQLLIYFQVVPWLPA